MTGTAKGNLVEIFSSVEGEGADVGKRTVFVRFFGCSFGCAYCDTRTARGKTPVALTLRAPIQGAVRLVPNPVSAGKVLQLVRELDALAGPHRRVCVTGGEPLEQPDFLAQVARALKSARFYVVLETNGTLARSAADVRDGLDMVCMDIKIPSATNVPPVWEEHRSFLEAVDGRKLVAKIIADEGITDEEVENVVSLVESRGDKIVVVLQPITERLKRLESPAVARLLAVQAAMLKRLPDVRIICQMHRLMGLP